MKMWPQTIADTGLPGSPDHEQHARRVGPPSGASPAAWPPCRTPSPCLWPTATWPTRSWSPTEAPPMVTIRSALAWPDQTPVPAQGTVSRAIGSRRAADRRFASNSAAKPVAIGGDDLIRGRHLAGLHQLVTRRDDRNDGLAGDRHHWRRSSPPAGPRRRGLTGAAPTSVSPVLKVCARRAGHSGPESRSVTERDRDRRRRATSSWMITRVCTVRQRRAREDPRRGASRDGRQSKPWPAAASPITLQLTRPSRDILVPRTA